MLCLPLYSLALLYFLAPVSGLAVSPTCDLALTWPSDNVLAHHLPGNWSFHTQLTEKMKPRTKGKDDDLQDLGEVMLEYTSNPEVMGEIPTDHCTFFKASNIEVYLAGYFSIAHIELGISRHIYVLISQNGVPGIVYWRDGEAVTNYVQMAPAAQMEADLLFLGEDDPKKPFAALHRHGAGELC